MSLRNFLTSWNRKEQMFLAQISLLIVIVLSLISRDMPLMQTTKEGIPTPSHYGMCLHFSNRINISRGLMVVGVLGFGDAKEGLRFCSLEVVGVEAWSDPVQKEFEAQYSSQKTCEI